MFDLTARRLLLCLLAGSSLVGCGRLRFEDHSVAAHADAGMGSPDAGSTPGMDGGTTHGDASAEDAGSHLLDAGFDGGELLGDAQMGGPDAMACPAGTSGPSCQTCVRYVNAASTAGTPDGLSWDTAFTDILMAASSAVNAVEAAGGPALCQVWVAKGRYHTFYTNNIDGIPLHPLLELYGGFAGTETSTDQRDRSANETVIDASNAAGTGRSYYPIYSSNGGFMDGFTITASAGPYGGGIEVEGGTLTLRYMVFDNLDSATGLAEVGGALKLVNASANLEVCLFRFNHARRGGAISVQNGSVTMSVGSFVGNSSTEAGGAIYANNASVTLQGVALDSQSADGSGGAIAMESTSVPNLVLDGVLINAASSGGSGGCIHSTGGVNLDFQNVVASDCQAGGEGGAFFFDTARGSLRAVTTAGGVAGSTASGMVLRCAAACSVVNSIFWDASALAEVSRSGPSTVSYSLVRGGTTGTGIVTGDPLFVSSPNDVTLRAGSPAIDAANGCLGPEFDLEGNPRYDTTATANTGVGPVFSDMGAYEYSVSGTPYANFGALCP
ncbi:MAG: choice-of-anchor Q domain-containing protein [Myxococcales bacterium]